MRDANRHMHTHTHDMRRFRVRVGGGKEARTRTLGAGTRCRCKHCRSLTHMHSRSLTHLIYADSTALLPLSLSSCPAAVKEGAELISFRLTSSADIVRRVPRKAHSLTLSLPSTLFMSCAR